MSTHPVVHGNVTYRREQYEINTTGYQMCTQTCLLSHALPACFTRCRVVGGARYLLYSHVKTALLTSQ